MKQFSFIAISTLGLATANFSLEWLSRLGYSHHWAVSLIVFVVLFAVSQSVVKRLSEVILSMGLHYNAISISKTVVTALGFVLLLLFTYRLYVFNPRWYEYIMSISLYLFIFLSSISPPTKEEIKELATAIRSIEDNSSNS
jgi:uncharacterized protein YacL